MSEVDVVGQHEPTKEELGLIASILEIRQAADEVERLVQAITAQVTALEDLRISLTLAKEALG